MPRWQNLTNPREEKFIRGYSMYMGGGCGEFRALQPTRRIWSEFKRNIKRYYRRGWGADSGAFAAESDELRGH